MNNDFVELCKEVQQLRPNMKIRHGGTGGAAFKPKPRPSPMKILKNWIEDNQMRLLDLFNTLDKDKSMNITVKEFADGLKVIAFALCSLMKECNIGSLQCRIQTLR